MFRFSFAAGLALAFTGAVLGNPMPELPDLPPLPTNYAVVGGFEGTYAGVLGGVAREIDASSVLTVVGGRLVMTGDLLLGAEVLGSVDAQGDASLGLDLRGGLQLEDSVAIFAHAGLGYATDNGSFLGVGSSVEFALFGTMTLRSQYRHAHDFSGDSGRHTILSGVIFRF